MLNQIRNYAQLTSTIGTSGRPTIEQFGAIATAGYQCVINLAMLDSDDAIATEGCVITALGMAYIHLPVPFEKPSQGQLKTFIKLMDAFDDQKIWVHCVMNYRVSAFLYHYLHTYKGWAKQKVRSVIFQQWQPNATWEAFLSLDNHTLAL